MVFVGEINHKFLPNKKLKKTEVENFVRKASCKHGRRSAMSISAWCDLNKNCTGLKLHDMCHFSKCNCQKQITFTPSNFDWKVVVLQIR